MALDKSKPDDFQPDNATNADDRRQKLINLLRLSWNSEDIQEIERVIRNNREGWAMWRHKPGDPWRQL